MTLQGRDAEAQRGEGPCSGPLRLWVLELGSPHHLPGAFLWLMEETWGLESLPSGVKAADGDGAVVRCSTSRSWVPGSCGGRDSNIPAWSCREGTWTPARPGPASGAEDPQALLPQASPLRAPSWVGDRDPRPPGPLNCSQVGGRPASAPFSGWRCALDAQRRGCHTAGVGEGQRPAHPSFPSTCCQQGARMLGQDVGSRPEAPPGAERTLLLQTRAVHEFIPVLGCSPSLQGGLREAPSCASSSLSSSGSTQSPLARVGGHVAVPAGAALRGVPRTLGRVWSGLGIPCGREGL